MAESFSKFFREDLSNRLLEAGIAFGALNGVCVSDQPSKTSVDQVDYRPLCLDYLFVGHFFFQVRDLATHPQLITTTGIYEKQDGMLLASRWL